MVGAAAAVPVTARTPCSGTASPLRTQPCDTDSLRWPRDEGGSDVTWGELRSGKDRVLSNADKTSAHDAIVELIWNALDAEATEVEVTIERNELGAPLAVRVHDNGHGMSPDKVRDHFLTEGDSWKKEQRFSSELRRPMHGHLGRGRLLVYAVADVVRWSTVASTEAGARRTIIRGSRSQPAGFDISDPDPTDDVPGTVVELTMAASQKAARLTDDGFRDSLIELLGESLVAFDGTTVRWDGSVLSVDGSVVKREELELPAVAPEALRGHPTASLVVIEWTNAKRGSKLIHLCNEAGAVVTTHKADLVPSSTGWSAYLKWSGFADPELMGIADLHHPEFTHSELLSAATRSLNQYLTARLQAAKSDLVREWKDERVYPYSGEPDDPIDAAERELFDIVAVIASDAIPKKGTEQKRLTLGLLKAALESEPGQLSRALRALLKLEPEELEQLDRLLNRTQLASIIRAANRVTDRLDFVNGLASLLYSDETRRVFREVDQLHPMLVREPWVFGDEWDGCLSEHGLTRVVKAVLATQNPEAVVAVEPVTLEDGQRGRVDLLFHKAMPESERDRHLVVELKRPGKLTMQHFAQVTNYAVAITGHAEVAGTSTVWDFWLVGSELDDAVAAQRSDDANRKGFVRDYGRYRLWVIEWGELLDSIRRKYESFRASLEVVPTTEHGLEYVRRVHEEYLPVTARDPEDPNAEPAPPNE